MVQTEVSLGRFLKGSHFGGRAWWEGAHAHQQSMLLLLLLLLLLHEVVLVLTIQPDVEWAGDFELRQVRMQRSICLISVTWEGNGS